ncbi:outer membrane protein assembly factor BamA [Pseudahrensia aquimaris]|uniref:Outer membrane protein assembly factor BamA n=1 Tax=Pseudahrensia aquimaris TaxID=744461 RepID=A0ABW3FG82_9HYPH
MYSTAHIKMFFIRSAMAFVLAVAAFGTTTIVAATTAVQAQAAVVSSIQVRGNQRVDADTIRSYLTIEPGRSFSTFDTDESLRQLFATGLFSDVNITQSGRTLIVSVEENPTVNLVLFEGNDDVSDDRLKTIPQLQSLSIFNADQLESDRERVREAIRRSGRNSAEVTTRVDQLENNRVNIVFVINEGGRTKISRIDFVGNNAFGDRRLIEVISHNESNFLSWIRRDDIFDEDRLRADEERLRTFYYNRGYADFRVVSADAQLDQAENEYTITFTVEEGDRYSFGNITIDNGITAVTAEELQNELLIETGDVYSARNVEKTLLAMTTYIAETGYAFAEITPRGERNFDARTIDLTFFVDEGPRTYIERIEISGNTRTRGYVIRREFDISEGDAYNSVLVNKAKRRLEGLGFFESVRISTRPGSSPDRVVVVVQVVDKPTGELSFGGGFSTNDGAIGQVSISEKNFLGRGQFLKVSGGFGEETTKYTLSFTEPYFLGQRIAAGFDVTHETAESSDTVFFDNTITTARLRAGVELAEGLRFGAYYQFKREELSVPVNEDDDPADPDTLTNNIDLSPATQQSVDQSPYVTSSVGYAFDFNNLDNTRNPREGVKAKFEQEFAGIGGDAQYVRTEARITGYYLLSEDRDVVVLGSLGAGNVTSWGDDLRIIDTFFQGGETIRGFDSRGFGPRDTDTGESIGGTTYANATAEVQFPLPLLSRSYGVRAALFADAGILTDNAFGSSATIEDDAELRASVGASIIWDSPFGPLRGDFSHAIAKEDYDDTQFFRFGVSTRF